MKKIYLLVVAAWLLATGPLHAALFNSSTPDTLRKKLNYLFAPVDKSQIPTRNLKDYCSNTTEHFYIK